MVYMYSQSRTWRLGFTLACKDLRLNGEVVADDFTACLEIDSSFQYESTKLLESLDEES